MISLAKKELNMEPRIKNGWLRAILFLPMWLVIMGLVQGLGVVLVMVASGVDMANPDSADALFGEMSFQSPTMLIYIKYLVAI